MTVNFNTPKTFPYVYYVEASNEDEFVGPIAIRPNFPDDTFVGWNDTGSGKSYRFMKAFAEGDAKDLESKERAATKPPKKIEIMVNDQLNITLTYLDLNVYNTFVKKRIVGGPEFRSDEELQNHYLNTHFLGQF